MTRPNDLPADCPWPLRFGDTASIEYARSKLLPDPPHGLDLPVIFVPGTLHPDFFGGETPIMVPVHGKPYRVRVRTVSHNYEDEEITLLAGSEEDAMDMAEDIAADRALGDDAETEVENCDELSVDEVTPSMIEDFKRRRAA